MDRMKKAILNISNISKDIENLCYRIPSEATLSRILADIHFLRDEYCNLLKSLGSKEKADDLEKRADLIFMKGRN